jgi:hypothetical protein
LIFLFKGPYISSVLGLTGGLKEIQRGLPLRTLRQPPMKCEEIIEKKQVELLLENG